MKMVGAQHLWHSAELVADMRHFECELPILHNREKRAETTDVLECVTSDDQGAQADCGRREQPPELAVMVLVPCGNCLAAADDVEVGVAHRQIMLLHERELASQFLCMPTVVLVEEGNVVAGNRRHAA